ncbi:MAG TPA: rRNA pseudouridine synthase [Dehalococcoidia bacterium]|nr:rRNA pseudouridine synthase [Dehalococcoidia bacterium]
MVTRPLLKVLTRYGIGSRRRMTDAIKQGKVTVNGEVIENFNHIINPATDNIIVDGKAVDLNPKETVYLVLNKPKGVISTTSDEKGRRTVIDLLPEKYHHLRLYPVGRLDEDSTGLVLLTNDGDLTYRLTHPRFEHEKEYLVEIKGVLAADEIHKLKNGIRLEDGMTHPAKVKPVNSPPYNYSITIHEGRKRQIRRMFEHIKKPVLSLKRIRIGNLYIGELKEGAVKILRKSQVNSLLDS